MIPHDTPKTPVRKPRRLDHDNLQTAVLVAALSMVAAFWLWLIATPPPDYGPEPIPPTTETTTP